MKRIWGLSVFYRCPSIAFANEIGARRYGSSRSVLSEIAPLFLDRSCEAKQELIGKVSDLKHEILATGVDAENIKQILEQKGAPLFHQYPNGSAVIELMTQLKQFPSVAMEVFSWRRNRADLPSPMTAGEYSKGISAAGRLKCIDLAVELFKEASFYKQLKTTGLYNALMGAYVYNGLAMKCQALFRAMKTEPGCVPSITTYNILISAFGRLMLVDHMEATLAEIRDLKLSPTVNTYKGLISGYLTAWMWDKMEKAYQIMESGPLEPDIDIHLLMLRGYANSGMVKKMEKVYDVVKDHVNNEKFSLIRAMICAYCKSFEADKVEKIGELVKLIPDHEYRPWLNVLLICMYARVDLLDEMEKSIDEAFEQQVYITTVSIMRCIISNYFRHDAVDKLSEFIHRAETAGWRLCRSLYHCKMVMYAAHMRLDEMEGVLGEMERINMPLSKKTLSILFHAYEKWGERSKLELVAGLMWKRGYTFSLPHSQFN